MAPSQWGFSLWMLSLNFSATAHRLFQDLGPGTIGCRAYLLRAFLQAGLLPAWAVARRSSSWNQPLCKKRQKNSRPGFWSNFTWSFLTEISLRRNFQKKFNFVPVLNEVSAAKTCCRYNMRALFFVWCAPYMSLEWLPLNRRQLSYEPWVQLRTGTLTPWTYL